MNTASGYRRCCPLTKSGQASRRCSAVQGAGILAEGVILGVGQGYCCIEDFLSTAMTTHSCVCRHRYAQLLGLLRMRARSHVSHRGKSTNPFRLNAALDTGRETAVVLPLVAQLPNGTASGSVQVT